MNRRAFSSGLVVAFGFVTAARADDPPAQSTFSTDDVADALSTALSALDVPTGGNEIDVTGEDGQFKFAVRLSSEFKPAGKVPDDPTPGTVTPAFYLLLGMLQILDDQMRVTARIVNVETSEIIETAKGDATGTSKETITDAAQIAFSALSSLKT